MNPPTDRRTLLVGSLPFEDEATAMSKSLEILGDHLLLALPDGEIGEKSDRYPRGNRAAWVQTIIDLCEADPTSWRVVRRGTRNDAGFPVDYGSGPRLTPRYRPADMLDRLNFRWVGYVESSYPVFEKLREERGMNSLRFQVGLPTGLGIAFGMMSPLNAIRYARTFSRRMAIEANRIVELVGPANLAFQLEVPGDLALAYKLPGFLTKMAVNGVLRQLKDVVPGPRFGVHLCFGDLNHEALIRPGSIERAVHFTNLLVSRWPSTHDLAYVHFPLAEASSPPSMSPTYYAPLANLTLPTQVRLVAGFVHHRLNEDEHRELLAIVEHAAGRSVDVAASCGLGRLEPETADRMLRMTASLLAPPETGESGVGLGK